jgi:RNA polymerase sigma factor (sigma-70 family)
MDLADLATERVSDLPDEEDLHEVLRAIVTLPVPLRRVIRLRYGLYGHEPMTQREAAARIGLTRQRVHQLEHEAIKELRQRLGGAA